MATASLIAQRFRELFGSEPDVVASAPGRVNVIGEHTDYNEGFVLPMAIEARSWIALGLRPDERSVIRSAQFGGTLEFGAAECDAQPRGLWHDLARGIVCEFAALGNDERRSASPVCDMVVPHASHASVLIDSDVPRGSGLSSSAAVEMSLARALCEAEGHPWSPIEMARLAQRVEHGYIGVRSGLMDQVISGGATAGNAMLLDCRTLEARSVPVPQEVAIVVMDTGVGRTLEASEYNERRAACESAVEEIRKEYPAVRSLRDVDSAMLASMARRLTETQHRRARHVVTENERVIAFAAALEAREYGVAGRLLNASHHSLRHDYEVSSTHLDIASGFARAHPSCYGARLTGAGFGGCAVALVAATDVDRFIADVQPKYEAASYRKSTFFRARPSAGARIDARTDTRGVRGAG